MHATDTDIQLIAFQGERLIAAGGATTVTAAVRTAALTRPADSQIEALLVFDALTGEQVDLDLRTSGGVAASGMMPLPIEEGDATGAESVSDASEIDATSIRRAGSTDAHRGPGRPKLGVVPREVTLLPRHWEWLASQPGGASATLRRLVDQARAASADRDRVRTGQERAYRFMSAMLGNAPDFEEATRALFAGDRARFTALTRSWPTDPRDQVRRLADAAFPSA